MQNIKYSIHLIEVENYKGKWNTILIFFMLSYLKDFEPNHSRKYIFRILFWCPKHLHLCQTFSQFCFLHSKICGSPNFPSLSGMSLLLPFGFSPKVLNSFWKDYSPNKYSSLSISAKACWNRILLFSPSKSIPVQCWFFPSSPTLLMKLHSSQAAPDFAESGMAPWCFHQMTVLGLRPCSKSCFVHPHQLE